MDEKDVTLYVNCRNKYSLSAMWDFIVNLLNVLKINYKTNDIFNILEIQIENDYIFFARFIDLENYNPKFLIEKYMISDQKILDYIEKAEKDEEVFKFIFGNFIKGLK